MICGGYGVDGVVYVVLPAPTDISTCALVFPTGSEVVGNPLALSEADGLAIAGAIVLVWGVGFVGRALIRALFLEESGNE